MDDFTKNILSEWGFEDMIEKFKGKLIFFFMLILLLIINNIVRAYTIIWTA